MRLVWVEQHPVLSTKSKAKRALASGVHRRRWECVRSSRRICSAKSSCVGNTTETAKCNRATLMIWIMARSNISRFPGGERKAAIPVRCALSNSVNEWAVHVDETETFVGLRNGNGRMVRTRAIALKYPRKYDCCETINVIPPSVFAPNGIQWTVRLSLSPSRSSLFRTTFSSVH